MRVELLALDCHDWEGVAADPEGFAQACTFTLGVEKAVLRTVAEQTVGLLRRTGTSEPPWSGFLAVDRAQDIIVGTCGFKAAPDPQGVVEIAYFTFPNFEGRGVASAMAVGLIECARGEAAVRRLLAHTLPEKNASTRVLEKVGFVQIGQVMDPEDGPVWRWERDLI